LIESTFKTFLQKQLLWPSLRALIRPSNTTSAAPSTTV